MLRHTDGIIQNHRNSVRFVNMTQARDPQTGFFIEKRFGMKWLIGLLADFFCQQNGGKIHMILTRKSILPKLGKSRWRPFRPSHSKKCACNSLFYTYISAHTISWFQRPRCSMFLFFHSNFYTDFYR